MDHVEEQSVACLQQGLHQGEVERFVSYLTAFIAADTPTEEDIQRFNRSDVERWIADANDRQGVVTGVQGGQ